jgi:hypothetical protein
MIQSKDRSVTAVCQEGPDLFLEESGQPMYQNRTVDLIFWS